MGVTDEEREKKEENDKQDFGKNILLKKISRSNSKVPNMVQGELHIFKKKLMKRTMQINKRWKNSATSFSPQFLHKTWTELIVNEALIFTDGK